MSALNAETNILSGFVMLSYANDRISYFGGESRAVR